jgi:hypothetical protein
MIPAFVLALAVQAPAAEESSTYSFLRFLARHQRADGSWGGQPATCTCPDERKPVPACDAAKVAPLLAALGDEDPGLRDSAQKELRALGESALPHLREAARHPDPEVRGRCAVLCRALELEARGGGDAELTGLALLAFLGAGYSHLSKDEFDGLCFGTVVKRGLQWLLARQEESGSIDPEDAAANSVATYALVEAYGMTASQTLREPAQRGVDRLLVAPAGTTRDLVWKGLALKSAELGELTFPRAAYDSLDAIRLKEGDLAIAGSVMLSILIHKKKGDPRLADLRKLDPAGLETETLHVATSAAFQFDGPSGPVWKGWSEQVKRRLLPTQRLKKGECERGSWDGKTFRARLQATALNGMNFEFYTR